MNVQSRVGTDAWRSAPASARAGGGDRGSGARGARRGRLAANLDKRQTNLGKLASASAICANPMQVLWDLAELVLAPRPKPRDREEGEDLKQHLNTVKEQMAQLSEKAETMETTSRTARRPPREG
jgi:hypothetical protein